MSEDDTPQPKKAVTVANDEKLRSNILFLNNDPATITKELLLKVYLLFYISG